MEDLSRPADAALIRRLAADLDQARPMQPRPSQWCFIE